MSVFRRTFSTSYRRLNTIISSNPLPHPIPPPSVASMTSASGAPVASAPPLDPGRRRVGAIKGGILGFLVGATLTLTLTYTRLIEEYKMANTMVVGDVASLRASIASLEQAVLNLEEDAKKK